MKLKELQDAMIAAMKAKDKFRKDAIADLVSAVKKKGIDAGCRENIPDDMAIEAILKEIKTVKEQIDTCPADRTELLFFHRTRRFRHGDRLCGRERAVQDDRRKENRTLTRDFQ